MSQKPGMSYNEARARIQRLASSRHGHIDAKRNLANSILNQVRVREGGGAANELQREFSR